MSNTIDYFIDGKRVAPQTDTRCANFNPATGEVLAEVALDEVTAADAAVLAARDAYPAWRDTPVGERCQILFRFKQLLEDHFDELAQMIVTEHGKNMPEARGDVRRGIDSVENA